MLKRLRLAFALAALLCVAASAPAADRYPVDWTQLESETMDYYTSILRIDTSNPPGDETKAVNYLKPILDRAGIPSLVLALDPRHPGASLLGRLSVDVALRRLGEARRADQAERCNDRRL